MGYGNNKPWGELEGDLNRCAGASYQGKPVETGTGTKVHDFIKEQFAAAGLDVDTDDYPAVERVVECIRDGLEIEFD